MSEIVAASPWSFASSNLFTMKHALTRALLAAVLSLWLTTSAWAGFDEGAAAYERGDYATAFEEMLPIAEQGDANAQFNLGFMYDNGEGVPQDYAEAVRWYRLAAEQGNAFAQVNLGIMYANG
jgi:TPR repeat protein